MPGARRLRRFSVGRETHVRTLRCCRTRKRPSQAAKTCAWQGQFEAHSSKRGALQCKRRAPRAAWSLAGGSRLRSSDSTHPTQNRREQEPEATGEQQQQQALAHGFAELVLVVLERDRRGHADEPVAVGIQADADVIAIGEGRPMQGVLARGGAVG